MKDTVLLGLVFVFILIVAGMLFVKVEKPVIEERIVYIEEPLSKNRNFSLTPDTALIYNIADADNLTTNVSFVTAKGSNCIWLYADGGEPLSCLKNDGTDESNSNITLNDRSIFFFRPWMLALNDSFEWNGRGCFVINNKTVCNFNLSIKVIRTDYTNNKKYYVIRLSSGSFETYQWIEDDRRIMVKELASNYAITLIE